MDNFSHYGDDGQSQMVDISEKKPTERFASAIGYVVVSENTINLIKNNLLPKGNPFEVARIAGIIAAKKTAEMIPLCHQLLYDFIDISISIDSSKPMIKLVSEIRLKGSTGAEMEALTAVSMAALTIYDMCKAVDKNMVIEGICLVKKTGGKSDYLKK